MATIQLLGAALGLGFVSGINLYATILAVGAGIHMGLSIPVRASRDCSCWVTRWC